MNKHIRAAQPFMRKVPEVTIYFWSIKLLTTALGESTSDYLVHRLNPYLAVALGFVSFAIALTMQFTVRHYIAWIYWLAVTMVAIFGTMAADVLHVGLAIPYAISATCFAIILAIIFTTWYKSEGTLSIHSISTPRRESFYWMTVLATFALGTSASDLAVYTAHLGFLSTGIVFAVVFAIPLFGWWRFSLNPIFAFWFAYIMTRPLGASFADWTAKSRNFGGLGWGDLPVSLILGASIVCLVGYLRVNHVRQQGKAKRGR